jgi:ATP synthase protein I
MVSPREGKSAKRTGEALRSAALLSGMGFTSAASVALGALGGNWLDHRWGTAPWLLVVGFFLGVAAAVLQTARLLSQTGSKRSDDT